MEKIYYEDQYVREFTAEIEHIIEKDGKFHVVLDRTAFFPGGGGQSQDKGMIDVHPVIDVYEEDGVVYHVTEKKPIKIHKVKCVLDWENRFDGMQQHLGQHVLSGCFFKLFNANTAGIHLGKEVSTIDIIGSIDEKQVRAVEIKANEVIHQGMKVEFLWPTKSELKKLGLRRALPNTDEAIRVVKIGDLDINACCGVHPSDCRDLQLIKIKKWEKHKNNTTRIEFLAGKRAVEDYFKKDDFATEICRFLNCNELEVTNAINNLTTQLKETLDENKKLTEKVGSYEVKEMLENAEKIKDITVVKCLYINENLKYLSKLASKLVDNEKVIVLFGNKVEDKVNLNFSASKDIKAVSMNDLLKDAITLVDGRGGGSALMAQGAGKNVGNAESALDYAFMKIKNTLA